MEEGNMGSSLIWYPECVYSFRAKDLDFQSIVMKDIPSVFVKTRRQQMKDVGYSKNQWFFSGGQNVITGFCFVKPKLLSILSHERRSFHIRKTSNEDVAPYERLQFSTDERPALAHSQL